jgi:hypothetical protein
MRRMALDLSKYESRSWADVTDTEWSDITTISPGVVTSVTVSAATQYLYALNDLHEVYSCRKPCATGAWIAIGGGSSPTTGPDVITMIDAGQTQLLAVTASGKVLKREHDDAFNMAWVKVPVTVTNAHENPATPVLMQDGFKSLTVSANPYPQQDFELYTVEREPRICGLASTAEACLELEDDGCIFSEEVQACEKLVPQLYSRLQDKEILFNDETCAVLEGITSGGIIERQAGYALVQATVGADLAVVADDDCVADGVRRLLPGDKPVCWDHNATISGAQSCVDVDGHIQYNCVNVGFSSTAFIVQCQDGQPCGTFIEVHRSGDNKILSQVRIPRTSSRTSGYRTMAVSLLYTDGKNFDWLNNDMADAHVGGSEFGNSNPGESSADASSAEATSATGSGWVDTASSGGAPGTAQSQTFEEFRDEVSFNDA